MAQHLLALESANEIRIARSELKKAVKAREVLVAEVLLGETPDWLRQMSVEALALTVPGLGQRRFQRLMNGAQISLGARIGNLTQRQRDALAETFCEWELRVPRRAKRAA